MKLSHLLMVLTVVALWGFNFVFIRLGLNGVPPILLVGLRFLLSAFPAVFFIRRPPCPWPALIKYGLVMFALQFTLLFSAMKLGMSPGLASLIMQLQAFFTMAIAAWVLRERPSAWKISGALISMTGIGLVAFHANLNDVTLPGLTLTLMGAMAWGCGNILSKKVGAVSPVALVVWGSLVACPVLLLLSLSIEGPQAIEQAITHMSWTSVGAIAYIVYFSTHISYSLWSYLLGIYPASSVAPFSLLVPIFGFMGSVLILGEPLPHWKIQAGILVISGLCFNILETRVKGFLLTKTKPNV